MASFLDAILAASAIELAAWRGERPVLRDVDEAEQRDVLPAARGLTACRDEDYIIVVIPPFDPATGNLPPGLHQATWGELVARYGYNPHRLALLAGLKAALDALRTAGCRRVYLDGSFVASKEIPNDFDACWEIAGVDFDLLDLREPALLDWKGLRAAQKAKFGGELFIAEAATDAWGTPYLQFFQRDRLAGEPKGIVVIELEELP